MSNIKLSQLQKDILIFFGKNHFGKNFYWTGGTLLAYQYLHHRISFDLDFFSDDLFTELPKEAKVKKRTKFSSPTDDQYLMFLNSLKKQVRVKKITLTLQQNRRLYLAERDGEAVKLELVYFPFPAIEKKFFLPEFSLKVDSLTDIMVNKTLSTYQRQEPKDVFDLYCYLNNQSKHNLQKLIKLVERKFGIAIEPTILLAKINELAAQLDSLSPHLVVPQKDLKRKAKRFFQNIFNSIVRKQIK